MATVNYDLEYKRKRKRKRNRKEDNDVEIKSRIDDLNDTLLELIFTRLSPWKSLVISKSVSKRWNSIISNPDFNRQLLPQSFPITLVNSNGECLATEHPYFQKHEFHLDFIPNISPNIVVANISPNIIVASTNDLIVAYSKFKYWPKIELYVANPLTKQYVVVPIASANPIISQYWLNMIGIAGVLDRFRIVQVIGGNQKSAVQIYASETGQWKTYLFDGFEDPWSRFEPAITWNNKIHGIINSKLVIIDPFNIDNVAPRLVNLPTELDGNYVYSRTLSICQNQLRIGQVHQTRSDKRSKNQRIKIWEIEDYDKVDDLGTNYSVKVKLVIDFEMKRLLLNREILRGARICRCHPTDPQVVYLSHRLGSSYRCNLVEKKCKLMSNTAGFPFNMFVLAHPP